MVLRHGSKEPVFFAQAKRKPRMKEEDEPTAPKSHIETAKQATGKILRESFVLHHCCKDQQGFHSLLFSLFRVKASSQDAKMKLQMYHESRSLCID